MVKNFVLSLVYEPAALNTHKGVLQVPAPAAVEDPNHNCSEEVINQQHNVNSQCV